MEVLQANLSKINIPTAATSLYKDECVYTFHTPESEGGLLIDLNSFLGFSPEYALLNFQRTGNAVYLNISKKRVPKKRRANAMDETGAPKVLGVGVPGGFFDRDQNYEFETSLAIVLLPDYSRIELPNADIPMKVQLSVDAVMAFDAASMKQEVATLMLTNDCGPSKYAEGLLQLDNGVKIAKSGWKCEKCDKTKNLWLNLSDGMILCGRVIVGSELSGNGHALEHYKETGFPLVVKLGTISADGSADCYSYAPDEDDSVLDPRLERHLLHWGIDLKEMKKTEKSVAELEIELQHTFEWSSILESDAKLLPLYGPGHTGLVNLGNSCYMNSVLQVLFSLPEFIQRYHENAQHLFETPKRDSVPQDFHCQLAKVARGLLSGDYSKTPSEAELQEEADRKERLKREAEQAKEEPAGWTPPVDPNDFPKFIERGIKPLMLKTLVGHGHPDFSTNHQQDALEYFAHLLEFIARQEHARGDKDVNGQVVQDPTNALRFGMETRFECSSSGQVGYSTAVQPYLTVPVPFSQALNRSEFEAYEAEYKEAEKESKDKASKIPVVLPKFTLQQCLDHLFTAEPVEDWLSPATNEKTIAFKSLKFKTFPEYLTLQIAKFKTDEGWIPKKVAMSLDVPDILDLDHLRGTGLQPGETALPEAAPAPAAASSASSQSDATLFDESIVAQLVDMGIPLVRAQHASHANRGGDADAALQWLFSPAGQGPEVDLPLQAKPKPAAAAAPVAAAAGPSEDLIGQVMEMGFSKPQAIKALKNSANDVARAIDWLFSHPDDDGSEDAAPAGDSNASAGAATAVSTASLPDGKGRYQLFAFISHMGSSTMSGHYVVHVLKDGRWVFFNDEKVAESLHPHRDLAYLYFYKRIH